jgi:hypothetical protein
MRPAAAAGIALVAGIGIGVLIGRPASAPSETAAAAPAEAPKGGQDQTGPYTVAENWPKPLSQLPGHEKWTWGAVQGIFAESPNRVYVLMRGELPLLERPTEVPYPNIGPSISFPVSQTPFRNASVGPVTSPGNTGSDGWNGWQGKLGVDARWEHNLFVVDGEGNIIESWTQWDSIMRRPHSVFVNPYDPEKHVWVVDDRQHAVYKFTNDGKQLVQTLGVRGEAGTDDTHFNRPTFMAWLPDSTLYVSDGYANTRVVKFDKDGKFLLAWGEKGTPPNDTRPGTFDAVHGVVVDPDTRRVYVTDRSSARIQIFDENGKYLDQFSTGGPSTPQVLYMSAEDREVRPEWAIPVFLGQPGTVARCDVEPARHERRPGRQHVPGGGQQRPGAEIRAAARREQGAPDWPACASGRRLRVIAGAELARP